MKKSAAEQENVFPESKANLMFSTGNKLVEAFPIKEIHNQVTAPAARF